MSPTADDLRDRLSRDLDSFGTLPSVAGDVLESGRSVRRRRRVVVGGAAALVMTVVAAAALGTGASPAERSVDPAADASAGPTASPTAAATAGLRPRGDFNDLFVETMDALLPERYGDVRVHQLGLGAMTRFRVGSADQGLELVLLDLSRTGYADDYPVGSCDPVWWIVSCVVADIPGDAIGRAWHQSVVPMDGSAGPDPDPVHAAGGELEAPGISASLYIKPVGPNAPVLLTDQEIAAILEAPEFLALVEAGVKLHS